MWDNYIERFRSDISDAEAVNEMYYSQSPLVFCAPMIDPNQVAEVDGM